MSDPSNIDLDFDADFSNIPRQTSGPPRASGFATLSQDKMEELLAQMMQTSINQDSNATANIQTLSNANSVFESQKAAMDAMAQAMASASASLANSPNGNANAQNDFVVAKRHGWPMAIVHRSMSGFADNPAVITGRHNLNLAGNRYTRRDCVDLTLLACLESAILAGDSAAALALVRERQTEVTVLCSTAPEGEKREARLNEAARAKSTFISQDSGISRQLLASPPTARQIKEELSESDVASAHCVTFKSV